MELNKFQDLVNYGIITDVQFVSDNSAAGADLSAITVEDLKDKKLITQVDLSKRQEMTPVEPALKQATLTFDLNPADAELTVNGKLCPEKMVVVNEGETVNYTAKKVGYIEKSGSVLVDAAAKTEPVVLDVITYNIQFHVTPETAVLEVDGQPCPDKMVEVKHGQTINYKATADGCQPISGSKLIESIDPIILNLNATLPGPTGPSDPVEPATPVAPTPKTRKK